MLNLADQVRLVVSVPQFWPAAVSIVSCAALFGAIIDGNWRRITYWLIPLAIFPFLSDALHSAVLDTSGVEQVVSPYLIAAVVAVLSFGGAFIGAAITNRQNRRTECRMAAMVQWTEQVLRRQ